MPRRCPPGNDDLLKCWRVSNNLQYALDGQAWDPQSVALVTRIVNARAVPGSGCFFHCGDGPVDDDDRNMLDQLELFGIVRRVNSDGPLFSMWSLSDLAMTLLRPCREILNPMPALADRGLPLLQRSNYELILALQSDGWTWAAARKKDELAPFEVGVAPKVWYTSGADLPRDYACCLLCSADLQEKRLEAGKESVHRWWVGERVVKCISMLGFINLTALSLDLQDELVHGGPTVFDPK